MDTTWATFTRRTDDPKLGWLETKLTAAGIPHRRRGHSWHAPILEVSAAHLDAAWDVLAPIDEIPDDDPIFVDDPCGCSCGPKDGGAESVCAFCAVDAVVARILESSCAR